MLLPLDKQIVALIVPEVSFFFLFLKTSQTRKIRLAFRDENVINNRVPFKANSDDKSY